ncbi:MAG: DUF1579 domain-containing protein [Candidatus Riflebacteria bacterium]|nr:DUF1579 domain-containing protein [Candidatus Riflebacteria bacterium]
MFKSNSLRFFFFLVLIAASIQAYAETSDECLTEMKKLDFMRGIWAGPASGTNPEGKPYAVYQTERMGTMLNGQLVVIEGRGYLPDGKVAFNAFGIVSWNSFTKKYEIRSYAQGMSGTFDFIPTANGYIWTIPAGKGTIRYTATVNGNNWKEVGELIEAGKTIEKNFEMNLKKVGPTDWPSENPVSPNAGKM